MRKLKHVLGCIALVLTAAMVVAVQGDSSSWATSDALGSVVVSFDGRVTVYDGETVAQTETIPASGALTNPIAGANDDIAFDNALNLFVANAATTNRVVALKEAAPHGHDPLLTLATGSAVPRALAFAGDGTLYVGSTDGTIGTIRRYAPGATTPQTFNIPVDPIPQNASACMGIDLGADQQTLYVVTGGGTVLQVNNAAGPSTPVPQIFKTLTGQGRACGIRLLAPERGSFERRHGGMLIAFGRNISRLGRSASDAVVEFKGAGSAAQQNWVDVAVDPRMVYDANNPSIGIDPNEYIFWGIDAAQRQIARFQTDQANKSLALLSVSTGLDVPRGIAVNGELRVAQVVRLLTLAAPGVKVPVSFLQGTSSQHSWGAVVPVPEPEEPPNVPGPGENIAVIAFEVKSDGIVDVSPDPLTGRCPPSLDGDCRFNTHFLSGSPLRTPTAIGYSRGRAVAYRTVQFTSAPWTAPPTPIHIKASIAYTDTNATGGGPLCSGGPAGAAASILRDPYLPTPPSMQNGHDQFEFDNTESFYEGDDTENSETIPLNTDYIAVLRTDVKYVATMFKPDPTIVTTPQIGSTQAITIEVRDPNSTPTPCAPVQNLENVLVLTVTKLAGDPATTKGAGTPVGDSVTPLSLGSNGLPPWVFTEGQWRNNLVYDPAVFTVDSYYTICVNAKAVNNERAINDACATVKIVKGGGKK